MTHRYTVLKEAIKLRQILNGPVFKHVMFYDSIKRSKHVSEFKILTVGVFVT